MLIYIYIYIYIYSSYQEPWRPKIWPSPLSCTPDSDHNDFLHDISSKGWGARAPFCYT